MQLEAMQTCFNHLENILQQSHMSIHRCDWFWTHFQTCQYTCIYMLLVWLLHAIPQFPSWCWGISFLHVFREVRRDLNLWIKKELDEERAKLYMVLDSKSHAQVESTAEFKVLVSAVGFRQVDIQLKVSDRLFGQLYLIDRLYDTAPHPTLLPDNSSCCSYHVHVYSGGYWGRLSRLLLGKFQGKVVMVAKSLTSTEGQM